MRAVTDLLYEVSSVLLGAPLNEPTQRARIQVGQDLA